MRLAQVTIRPVRQSVRPSLVFLAFLTLTVIGAALAWTAGANYQPLAYVGVFVFIIAGWVVSLSLHEFAHAFTAWRFGDHDVAARGYLTLNPFKYAHPVLSVVLPALIILIGGIGLPGGAVWVQTSFMSKAQKSIVSLSGPMTNVVAAVVLLVATPLLYMPEHRVFWAAVAFMGFLQATAAVLNLLPIPGLDGYSALEPHLSLQTQRALQPAKQWAFFVVLLLLIATPLNQYFWSLVRWIVEAAGVPDGLVPLGYSLTRFWSAWL
jgi:Zn-dependent protease